MTPDKARDLLDGTTPGPWKADESAVLDREDWSIFLDGENLTASAATPADATLAAAAPDMAAMLAGMTTEYAIQGSYGEPKEWFRLTEWQEDMPPQGTLRALVDEDTGERWQIDTRIIVRYVTAPQPLGEEQ